MTEKENCREETGAFSFFIQTSTGSGFYTVAPRIVDAERDLGEVNSDPTLQQFNSKLSVFAGAVRVTATHPSGEKKPANIQGVLLKLVAKKTYDKNPLGLFLLRFLRKRVEKLMLISNPGIVPRDPHIQIQI
ncbi:hypothetical protein KQX54_020804 [Cotesia glomerata]|uniref:Uncharacterized protein n=1 Tax=Cotesia glomerata TaxID=32391 RepID=A0AAV7I3A1_COTGL|nr:hypothetical protein KQX54_020804 [Cotesia glomerata]